MANAKDIRAIEMEERGGALGSAILRNINTKSITGTAETSMIPTSLLGSAILTPEDLSVVGRTFKIFGECELTTSAASAGTGTIRIKLGSTTILTSAAETLPNNLSSVRAIFEIIATITDSGKIRISGGTVFSNTTGLGGTLIRKLATTTDQIITITSNQTLDVTYQFSGASNTLVVREINIIRY